MKVYLVEGRTMVIAESELQATVIYRENFGDNRHKLKIKRVTSGFQLSYQGDPCFEVDEEEFIGLVSTYGGGIVHDD